MIVRLPAPEIAACKGLPRRLDVRQIGTGFIIAVQDTDIVYGLS